MHTHEIRRKYLAFFQKQGHAIIPSAPLIPEHDPTTLFTGSGMQPILPYLLGAPHPEGTRLTNSQKCFRAEDIPEVGDNRHTTFFEMLGNWSLGDYFQKEQITWIFTFLTQEIGLDPKRLYVSVFRGKETIGVSRDDVSIQLWQEQFRRVGTRAKAVDDSWHKGLQGGHIFYYDEKKNWWSRSGVPEKMPVGEPGGPDSEMFWDFGAEWQLHENSIFKDQVCHVNCDCGRFMEIGNNVFMTYLRTRDGFTPLPKKNVDFGGGLERIAAAVNNNPDIFRIDIFSEARNTLEQLSGISYGSATQATKVFRIILDHIRAATFLIADGVYPSNKDQGYFVRRLLRRALQYASQIHIEKQCAALLVENFIALYERVYPELVRNKTRIVQEIVQEEEKFRKTLTRGLKVFSQIRDNGKISGEQAFDLFTTYGFPFEMTQELAQAAGIVVDTQGFHEAMQKHQELSRTGASQKFSGGLADHSQFTVRGHTATHLLHQALRKVLGPHVVQKGSNITPQRIRFDFSHPTKLSDSELQAVERIVNEEIRRDLPVSFEVLSVAEAKKKGAMGVFDERYGSKVKVYRIGDFSYEICGGPHVAHTTEVGKFRIVKEEACSAGVRRIKAVLT
ncbi:MAG: hypothetical protein A3B74_03730 [Candidatus Kerfeldbacteria bacterium RIFCSPHIGHO2_02_FULL_42_14]|uniref:Alanine--tRNA ligase n=1 Tax=Candidatus Kerfeldbacteria bacterium RIFCSPHIGHO2_02_FULL_42_14 TaxID=1798540 RepID=A0A1G2AQ04_9BACT|nr:MAG: hypothetical protein A3B74_03730 [Candidatus Kerfeldbacteria bacterium RIFCSPHIGHO2_02_FULL_42_14]OGY80627.1 MAG: hypothetical protein A3E60_04230 [Candidatus Kerfeldbacteria bacterium RIFCSPHIGHO2_12_FULL_42_13]OGY82551.1 MAG: hypothetical protein A3I91_03890 [Candidatus Kerfeldbacteria bacterium RIFCSPLOWO2_02_FULL_42_19]OGY85155.1 MAG: hypothetical protein A3G01_01020 [Candidatus Kerfeldbacteria bacterium RIFCSPLOWO2_12_FULL_43_9]